MTIDEAETELDRAGRLNPGKWVAHSRNVARAARLLAGAAHFDPDFAFKAGLLHDIGRRVGVCHLRHVWEGYLFLQNDEPRIAEICLSHSFPNQDLREFQGATDLDPPDLTALRERLNTVVYDDYDRLLQLCDSLGTAEGFVRPEVRWVDVALRLGVNEFTVPKWKKCLEFQAELELRNGFSVLALLGIA